ncbi:unannotated protein [freshwater metagenome]|uniref:Unannotated protein n=1 Tax=freshwater metagenome TaxID=449393 RepID=A0A6J6E842_9ZZZZ
MLFALVDDSVGRDQLPAMFDRTKARAMLRQEYRKPQQIDLQ